MLFRSDSVDQVERFGKHGQRTKGIQEKCKELGANVCLSNVWAEGGDGGINLAKEVIRLCENNEENNFHFAYNETDSIKQKIEDIATKIYGANGVDYTKDAEKDIKALTENGFNKLPICMAKTQSSLSDDPKKLGRPENKPKTF